KLSCGSGAVCVSSPSDMSDKHTGNHAARRAALRLVASSALFAVMALLAKLVSRRIPGPQTAFVRFAAGVAVTAALWAGGQVEIRPRRWRWLLARGLF